MRHYPSKERAGKPDGNVETIFADAQVVHGKVAMVKRDVCWCKAASPRRFTVSGWSHKPSRKRVGGLFCEATLASTETEHL
jgi:hypothetical protein